MLLYLGQMEIIEVEAISFHKISFKLTMTDHSKTEVNTCEEMQLIPDTMFVHMQCTRTV